MLTKLQQLTTATPEHSHSLGKCNYFDLRFTTSHNFPKKGLRAKSTKHSPSLQISRNFSRKHQALGKYYFWESGEKLPSFKDISRSYWKRLFLKDFDEYMGHAWKATHPEPGPFINWFKLIAKDAPTQTPPKIPKTKDWKARVEFAKSIGLSELPSQSDDSFKQLYGLFDGIMKYDNEHDSVESVRRIRRQ